MALLPAFYNSRAALSGIPKADFPENLRRLEEALPAVLTDSAGKGGVEAAIQGWDERMARLRTERMLPLGKRIRARFNLPRPVSNTFRGLPCEFEAKITDVRAVRTGAGLPTLYEIDFQWIRPFSAMVKKRIFRHQFKVGALLTALILTGIWLKWQNLDYFWYNPALHFYSLVLSIYLLSRFYLAWRHQSPPLNGYTPSVSVVISVRNEEKVIARTVESCLNADYPEELKEVIVVDDGSTDRTPQILEEMKKKYPQLLVETLQPSGKRYGMAAGVRRASGEIVVFVDSDTFLFPDALRHIVCGFEDPTLGATSGYTEVENATVNALTGLQEVRYYVSFKLLKSSESFFSCVTCCPGCLSAYRRSYVLEVLEPWLNQKFLGAPATFGDDRSLTNFILRKYRVTYNDYALATTLVPENWGQYMRQQVRWKKSWLRETLIASGFMFKKNPLAVLSFYASSLFSFASPIIVFRILFLEMQRTDAVFFYYGTGLMLMALIQSMYFLYRRPSSNWVYGFYWMLSSLFITGPQTYYALFTVRKNHWGTR